MRIVNLAHGNLYALGAYVTAWAVGASWPAARLPPPPLYVLLPVGAVAARGPRRHPRADHAPASLKRAEEYQLLITFGLLLILEDLMRLIWGPYPLSASALSEAWAA